MEEEVTIRISCDKYFAPDFLRQLANEIESRDGSYAADLTDFETEHGIAEID